jgi:hypothetical protein
VGRAARLLAEGALGLVVWALVLGAVSLGLQSLGVRDVWLLLPSSAFVATLLTYLTKAPSTAAARGSRV